ncbi:BH3-interacting domain death agonist-like [Scleropages formosus]|uniref:BH3-interacting domain death agonist n=1 Tax=Scleropages formosus TaxID=113540 RepID=A0A0P7VIW7_SCLFO|nr:BH3-interacting domain death agonist-like [Scleropages formosus]
MAKSGAAAPLLFIFLNVRGCGSEELRRQLCDLGWQQLELQLGLPGAGAGASEEDGELQADGHSCSSPFGFEEEHLHLRATSFAVTSPKRQLTWCVRHVCVVLLVPRSPGCVALSGRTGDRVDPAVLRAVAEELVRIADQLENRVVSRSVERLMERLQGAPNQSWKDYLSEEVMIMLHGSLGPELNQLPMERMLLALTFTLVKGVCERAPRFLRGLFHAAVQYVDGIPFLH